MSAVGLGGILVFDLLIGQISSHLRSKESGFLIRYPKDAGMGRYFLLGHSSGCQGIHKKLFEEEKRSKFRVSCLKFHMKGRLTEKVNYLSAFTTSKWLSCSE